MSAKNIGNADGCSENYPIVSSIVHVLGLTMSEDAPTMAAVQSPIRMLRHAKCKAYVLLAHAASAETLGP